MKKNQPKQRKLRKCEVGKKTKSFNKGFRSAYYSGKLWNITENGFIRGL